MSSHDQAADFRNALPLSSLTHLERLEAESIHIMREVVAEASSR